MFTRSQAKLLRENKEDQQRQQEQEQEQQQKNEKTLVAIDRIKQYIFDAENIGCSDCLTYCHRIQNRIRKIDELYEYMLSDEIKQEFFVSLFASYSTFIPSVFTKTKELKDQLVK